jgi:hypothetical protein
MTITSIEIRRAASLFLPVSGVLALAVSAVPAPAAAEPLPYGPDTCIQGYVWREARPGDTVCVLPAVRDRTATENAHPASNTDPLAGSGPESCSQGYVWREAFDGDTICVTPAERTDTLADNAAAQSRRQGDQPGQQAPANGSHRVVFNVTGSGEVFNIVTDPAGPFVPDHTPLPFTRTLDIGPDVSMLQVVATGRDDPGPGCSISIDGTVVASQPIGGSGHCIYVFP